MEQDFVELGRALRQLYSIATRLTGLVGQRAGGLRGALEQSRLAGAEGLAARPVQELRRMLADTTGLLLSLQEIGAALHLLHVQAPGIKRIGGSLQSSVVGFAIESSRTAECQAVFGTFVEGLRKLSTGIACLGDNIVQELKTTQTLQARGRACVSKGLEEIQHLTLQVEATARATTAEVQELIDDSFAALQEAEARAGQIARHADDAVYHLQFGDIIRQKEEHILAAVEEAAGLLSGANSGLDLRARAAAADRVLAIQAGQIELVRDEVLAAHTKLAASFQSIAAETGRLAQALERGQGALRTQGSATDPLQALTNDSLRLEALHKQGRTLGQQARETAKQAADSSTQLAQHLDQLRTINRDIHLQALNALIKAASLGGRGATLGVLSNHVDQLFRESNQQIAEIVATLNTLLLHAEGNAAAIGPGSIEDSAAGGRSNELRDGLERITRAYEEFRQTASEAAGLAQEQQASLARSSVDLQFLVGLAETFAEQLQNLASVRELLAPWAEQNGIRPPEMVESLDQRYTMQSEREVHQRVSDIAVPDTTPAAPSRVDANLTLFDEVLPAPLTNGLTTPVLDSSSESQQPQILTVPVAPPQEPALGDNVELF